MNTAARWFCMLLAVCGLSACGAGASPGEAGTTPQSVESASTQEGTSLKITVGKEELMATWEDNSSAREFQELLEQGPVTIEMEDYGGFEKVGTLGTDLT